MKQPKDYPEQGIKPVLQEKQSRLESILEVGLNITSGFIVSYFVWIYIVPILWPEHSSSHRVAFGITVLFTISSVIRSYIWRRFFANEVHKFIHSFVKEKFI